MKLDLQPIPEGDKLDLQPLDLQPLEPSEKTTWGEDNAIAEAGLKNTFTRFGGLMGGGIATMLGDTDTADEIYRSMDEKIKKRNQQANPKNKEQSFGGKAYGMLSTLPAQLLAMPFSPADTGATAIEKGESLRRAQAGAGLDTVGNMIGIAAPGTVGKSILAKILSGAGINAAQDTGVRFGLENIMQTKEAKEHFAPSMETAGLAAIPGAAIGGIHGVAGAKKAKKVKGKQADILRKLDETVNQKAMDKDIASLHDADIVNRLKELDARINAPDDALTARLTKLDEIVTKGEDMDFQRDVDSSKQALHEFDLLNLKQKLGEFDQMVDEGVGPVPDRMVRPLSAAEEAAAAQRELDAAGPIYVDPQGQAFRGDPAEPKAAEALERQGQAYDEALTNRAPIEEGVPLPALRKEHQGGIMDDLNQLETGTKSILDNFKKNAISSKGKMGRQRGAADFGGFMDEVTKLWQLWHKQDYTEVRSLPSNARPVKEYGPKQQTERYLTGKDANYDGHELYSKRPIKSSGPMGRQRGAVDTGAAKAAAEWLKKRSPFGKGGLAPAMTDDLNRMILADTDPEQVRQKALTEEDAKGGITGPTKNLESGALMAKAKRASSAIAGAAEWVQNAFKRAEVNIERNVFPVEDSLKNLEIEEMKTLQKILDKEFSNGDTPFDHATLIRAGLSDTQMKAYKDFRAMMKDTLDKQNAGRAARGQAPITPLEAYFASRWEGDFRRPVFDGNGKLVYVLAANTKWGLDRQMKELRKKFPDYYHDKKKDFTVRDVGRNTDVESAYTIMLDILGRDDPAVQHIKEWKESLAESAVGQYLGQEKHFKNKAGVRGYVGDRPGFNADKEALNFFQQQIQYAKNAYRWAEMQEAGQKIKKLVNDPELREKQPENLDYIRDYWKHAIGAAEYPWIRSLSDQFKKAGISLKPLVKGTNAVKSYFILSKLAANTGYTAANGISMTLAAPHLVDLAMKGYVGEPVSAIGTGLLMGSYMATRHAGDVLLNKSLPELPGQDFLNRAMQYAEDNGVTSRSIYDESPIENQFTVTGKVARGAGLTMTIPETYFRSMVFMTFVQYLKSSGKFTDEASLFKMAEERVNMAMTDYAQTERPMIFQKLGGLGNFLSTLQTFGINYYNQMSYFTREAAKGNPLPLVTMLTTQGLIAGTMGIPYAEDIYKSWMYMKDNWLSPGAWAKVQKNEFLSDPKLWAMENVGTWATYGAVADQLDLGITTRIAAPSMGQMAQSPAGPILDIAKQVGSVASAVGDPTNSTKWAQAAMNVAPVGLQGALETSPMMEGKTWVRRNRVDPETGEPINEKVYQRGSDIEAHSGEYTRNDRQEMMRRFGLRDQNEVLQRDLAYSSNRAEKAIKEQAKEVIKKAYDAIRREDQEAVQRYAILYTELTGEELTNEMIEGALTREHLTGAERANSAEGTIRNFVQSARVRRILEKTKEK